MASKTFESPLGSGACGSEVTTWFIAGCAIGGVGCTSFVARLARERGSMLVGSSGNGCCQYCQFLLLSIFSQSVARAHHRFRINSLGRNGVVSGWNLDKRAIERQKPVG